MTGGYKTSLSRRDIEVLKAVYQLQAIRTKDIVNVYFEGRPYGYDRLRHLCDKRYLRRRFLVTEKGQRHNSVYSIGQHAIESLYNLKEIKQRKRARDLQLPTNEMIQRIELSKLAIGLKKSGWTMWGSIEGKQKQRLPNNALMQCLLMTPEKEVYQVYQLYNTIQESTLAKLTIELTENKSGSIVLYKPENALNLEETPAYQDLVRTIEEERLSIQELCLIPLVKLKENGDMQDMALRMLTLGGNEYARAYLEKRYDVVDESDNSYNFGNMVVRKGNREYFVCNYLRRDRSVLRLLAKYFTWDDHQKTGKGVIVLTWNDFAEEVRYAIDRVQQRDFIEIEGL